MSKAKDDTTVTIEANGQKVETTMEAIANVGKNMKVVQIPEFLANSKEYKKLNS